MDYSNAIKDLKKANRTVIKGVRYACGLDEEAREIKEERARFFFESPDGQNGALYSALRDLGWNGNGYNAEYFWLVSKDGVLIRYVEGDIYLSPLNPAMNKEQLTEKLLMAIEAVAIEFMGEASKNDMSPLHENVLVEYVDSIADLLIEVKKQNT